MPFGRAWENRGFLWPDSTVARTSLSRAFDLAAKRHLVLWTNRLPPALLEGREDLLQDPHKIHDEVTGRASEFESLLLTGEPLRCREAPRCAECFMHGFCDYLDGALAALGGARPLSLGLDLDLPTHPPDRVLRTVRFSRLTSISGQRARSFLASKMPVAAAVLQWTGRTRRGFTASAIRKSLGHPWTRLACAHPEGLRVLANLDLQAPIEVVLNAATADWLKENLPLLRSRPKRFAISLQAFDTLADLKKTGAELVLALRQVQGLGIHLVDLPRCLARSGRPVREDPVLDERVLFQDGTLDLHALADDFIRRGYRLFSSRCRRCRLRSGCWGLPVQYARANGLAILRAIH